MDGKSGGRLEVIHLVGREPSTGGRRLVLRSPSIGGADDESLDGPSAVMTADAERSSSEQARDVLEVGLTRGAPTSVSDFLRDTGAELAKRAARTTATMLDLSRALADGDVTSLRLVTDNTEGRKVASVLATVAKAAGLGFDVDDQAGIKGTIERIAYRPTPATRLAGTTVREGVEAVRALQAGGVRRRPADGAGPPVEPVEHVVLAHGRNAPEHLVPIARALAGAGRPTAVVVTEAAGLRHQLDRPGSLHHAWPVVVSPRRVRDLRRHVEATVAASRHEMGLCAPTAAGLAAFVAADAAACLQRWARVVRALEQLDLERRAVGVTLYWAGIEGRALLGHFQRLGLPTASFSHGSLLAASLRPVVDHFFVWGDEMAEAAQRLWGDELAVTVTGNPHEEQVLAAEARPAAPAGGPTVVVAFGRPNVLIDEPDFLAALQQVGDAARALEGAVRFEVSVHPADHSGHWEAMAAAHPGLIELLPRGGFYPALHRSAGLVTMFSTAGSEAAFLDKPVFISSPGHVVERSGLAPQLVADGAGYLCTTAQELTDQVRAVVLDHDDPLADARARHAARFLHVDPDGRSSAEVIADELEAIRRA